MIPTAIPHGRTARRLEWAHLPPGVRREVEHRLGSPVVAAESQRAGYTPGFASVLTCADDTRHFVKGAPTKAQRGVASAYRIEAARLRTLPPETPAPRLQWLTEVEDWVVLAIEHVPARLPGRPWSADDLAAASAMLVRAAESLTPAPGIGIATAAEEFAAWPGYWQRVAEAYDGVDNAADAAELAGRHAEVLAGDTLAHTDVRDDNLLVRPDGSVLLCDWNWPVVAAPWFDSLCLLIGPRGDGLDVETHLAGHPLLGDVPSEHVDVALALLAGYFLKSAADPRPSNSPYVRDVQMWQGDVCWQWLCERRGWPC